MPKLVAEFQPIANLTTPRGTFIFYWWAAARSVTIQTDCEKNLMNWLIVPDSRIGETLSVILNTDSSKFSLSDNVLLFQGFQQKHGIEMINGDVFFDCDWSDYACDGLFVSGHLIIA